MHRKNGRRLAVWMISFILIVCFCSELLLASAAKMTDIRVGLKAFYTGKESITIKTASIAMGYCIDEKYSTEEEFKSSSGFLFEPAKGYYYILDNTYLSYTVASRVAKRLNDLFVDAFPVAVYKGYWKVYVGGSSSKVSMQDVYKKIEGRFGFTYSSLMEDNGQRVLVTGSSGKFLIDAEKKKAYPQFKAVGVNKAGAAVLDLGSRQYRGRIEIGRYGKTTLSAINIINVESYLYGVIPAEMVSSWHAEALKAQAVCARSYALIKTGYTADSRLTNAYYLDDTTSSQVYKGYSVETERTNKVVDQTKGQTVTYNGKTIKAYYYSTSGGSTENISDVWGISVPYLKRVPDLYESEPERKPWLISLTAQQISNKLVGNGFQIGTPLSVFSEITSGSGRVYSLKVKGSKKTATLQSESIRTILDLPSTKFTVVKSGDIPDQVVIISASGKKTAQISNSYVINGSSEVKKISQTVEQYIVKSASNLTNFSRKAPGNSDTWYFAGMGYGHGVGMSQSGAKGMAKEGYHYQEIIQYYFPGCKVSSDFS